MKIKQFLMAGLALLALTACSEKSDAVDEYGDWKNKNEKYFESAYNANDYDSAIKKYSYGTAVTPTSTDFILVDELEQGDESLPTPYLTDSVRIHYVGHLIPSPSYPEGYQFDQSYLEPFDWDTAVPRKFAVNGVVTGLTTALLKMHKGDHWVIAVPYQMGYGTVDNGEIPAYSTLIFEVRLEEFWTKRKGDRY
jgi:FKBP-type peptidyl-prolyl cis-trans isomerase FklB